MTGYTPAPDIVPSPWLDDIPDEAGAILVRTLNDLAMASEDRYARQIHRHRDGCAPSTSIRIGAGCEDRCIPTRICFAMTQRPLSPILMRDNSTCFALKIEWDNNF
ncbi:MAG: hypothetical protein M3N97_04930 [Pseudomonadota bacterium]|nr:hypothetical protein [Pseudomonadota bacterium]